MAEGKVKMRVVFDQQILFGNAALKVGSCGDINHLLRLYPMPFLADAQVEFSFGHVVKNVAGKRRGSVAEALQQPYLHLFI